MAFPMMFFSATEVPRLISISEILLCFVLALAALFEPQNKYIFIHF